MRVLGIESSCDETAAAVVDEHGGVYADVIHSQVLTHAPYGGVVPELASRAHAQAIVRVVQRALDDFGGGLDSIDAIAVTQGPGLLGSLLVGVQAAKGMAWASGKPLVGVNHLEGHLLSPFLHEVNDTAFIPPTFPYVALLVSGGHTALYRVQSAIEISLLGQTRDDAAGEAYDKVAKSLGLGYPGGPIVDKLAALGDANSIRLPRPMARHDGFDFSFSGLKAAVARYVEAHVSVDDEVQVRNTCAAFQALAIEHLVERSVAACRAEGVTELVITGGVAANRGLRARVAEVCGANGISLKVPSIQSCTDNAAMIAFAGALRWQRGESDAWDMSVYSRDPERERGRFRRDGTLVR